ncbi:MAG: DNA repair protein RecO C-terminal domain-containing protein [Thermanaerothrix sp.]|nr:DNA repair protein RecO C-terminal domain-containing protein [Thermanaerothrix sp.]
MGLSLPLHLHCDLSPRGPFRASGVVLRKEERERGRRVLFFLRGYGTLWATVPLGGRSTLGGASEVMSWGEFSFYRGHRSVVLKDAVIRASYLDLSGRPDALKCFIEACELLSSLPCMMRRDDLLKLLWALFIGLGAGVFPPVAFVRFLGRWLRLEGVMPDLFRCCLCGSPVTSRWGLAEQGVVCCGVYAVIGADVMAELLRTLYLRHDDFVKWSLAHFRGPSADEGLGVWERIIRWMRGFLFEANILLGREGS